MVNGRAVCQFLTVQMASRVERGMRTPRPVTREKKTPPPVTREKKASYKRPRLSGEKGFKSGPKGFKSAEKEFTSLENGFKSGEKGLTSRKPRIILAATGCVAAIKFGILAHNLCEWAEVKAVATESSLHFMDRDALPDSMPVYTDCDEKSSWKKLGDDFLHVELSRWADAVVIAPLSANTLAKIAGGLSDDLLCCVVRAWNYKKPVFVAPAMNTYMWENPFTKLHLLSLKELGAVVVSPMVNLQFKEAGNGTMEEPSVIDTVVRIALTAPMSFRFAQKKVGDNS